MGDGIIRGILPGGTATLGVTFDLALIVDNDLTVTLGPTLGRGPSMPRAPPRETPTPATYHSDAVTASPRSCQYEVLAGTSIKTRSQKHA